jgi:hypothetical protein
MNSRRKGKVGELEFAAHLRQYGFDARRGQQFTGGANSPDVVSQALDWIHFEVKRTQALNLRSAFLQAETDCGGKPWVVAHRRNHSPWLITMRSETFFEFLRGNLPPRDSPAGVVAPAGERTHSNTQIKIKQMKIKCNKSKFKPCPEYTGPGICGDVTPPRKHTSQFGEREVFHIVFETPLLKEDGTPYCVWSRGFTATLNEKSNFRKFLRGWFGRDLTKQEQDDFDTESLIGKTAHLVVINQFKGDGVFANIAACTPDKSDTAMKASGKFVRQKDRPAKNNENGSYRLVDQPANNETDFSAPKTKVHVGRWKGLELRELAEDQVKALTEYWLPGAKANASPTADDRRLIAALEALQANQQAGEDDNIPY